MKETGKKDYPFEVFELPEIFFCYCLYCFIVVELFANLIFDSSNAVLGKAFTPPSPREKVIAFCTAEMNFVLHSKQNKNKR
jgi:hypothetical protein